MTTKPTLTVRVKKIDQSWCVDRLGDMGWEDEGCFATYAAARVRFGEIKAGYAVVSSDKVSSGRGTVYELAREA